jgi:hypothetical protein
MSISTDTSLHQRRRPLTDAELSAIPWIHLLNSDERARARASERRRGAARRSGAGALAHLGLGRLGAVAAAEAGVVAGAELGAVHGERARRERERHEDAHCSAG